MGNSSSSSSADLSLPSESILIQILVRLPVFSLLRFKSVCKSWRALIESSFFIDLHTITTFNSSSSFSSSSKFDTFIIQSGEHYVRELERRTMLMLSSRSGDDDQEVVFKMDNLGFPSCYKVSPRWIGSIDMVGSCNGLICLYDSNLRDVSLWNPAIRQFRILPKSTINILEEEEETINYHVPYFSRHYRDTIMFGFDAETKDYKVAMITYFVDGAFRERLLQGLEYVCRVQVYSLSTNSWRLLEGIKSLPARPSIEEGLYLNGSYFFVGIPCQTRLRSATRRCHKNELMLSFDFTKEIFTTMQFPDHNQPDRSVVYVLGYLGGGKMALLRQHLSSSTGDDYDIWVLNENKEKSWTKLHSFGIKVDGGLARPKGIYSNGEFALIQIRTIIDDALDKLQLFNLGTKEAKQDFTTGRVQRAAIYEPSLVSIMDGIGAEEAEAAAAADRLVRNVYLTTS